MKKLTIIFLSIFFLNCDNNSESDLIAPTPEKVTYNTTIKNIMNVKCNICHNNNIANSYLTYQETKNDIEEILVRIQRNEGTPGAMPQGGPKLSQADINLFLKWKADGLLDNN